MSINTQLQEAYRLIRDNRKPDAMRILVPIVKADANHADAWWLLANAVPDPTQARRALEQVLRLRPGDEKAQKMLDRLGGGAFTPAAPPRQSFGGPDTADPAGSPFGIPPSAPPANAPFSGSFGVSGSGSSDPFGSPAPRSGRGAPAPGFTPYAPPPKRSGGGCRTIMIGCGVVSLLCIVACVGSLFFASTQIRTAIDAIGTQNPEVGGAVSGMLGAILQGNTPDPAILRTLEASGFNITIDPMLGGLAAQVASGIVQQPGAPLPGNVQMRGAIEIGQSVSGQVVANGPPQGYTLRANRGTAITVTVTAIGAASMLDPLVALYGTDGTQIAFNDDSAVADERLNSRLEFTLPVDGTYTLLVSAFTGLSGGDYTLQVRQG